MVISPPVAGILSGAVIRLRNRGVTYWKGAEGERIFDFVGDRVYAVDAKSGELIRSFGSGGTPPNPEGPIAHDASEAWPKKPTSVPTITTQELVQACAESTACAAQTPGAVSDPLLAVSL